MIEFIKPNPRKICPDCKKKFSKLWRCNDAIFRCGRCKRKRPTNKFFVPIKERHDYTGVSKWTFNKRERQHLYTQYIRQGLSPEEASHRINYHIYLLHQQQRRNRGLQRIRELRAKKKEEDAKESKKKFLEGLR